MNHSATKRAAMLAALTGFVLLCAAGPAAALSSDAQLIVDGVKAANPTLKPVCSDRGKLTTAVTAVTTNLAKAGKIAGDPRAAGQEAGRYLYFHCS
jgi:hypothetical protein